MSLPFIQIQPVVPPPEEAALTLTVFDPVAVVYVDALEASGV
jgi:hypothetical protein